MYRILRIADQTIWGCEYRACIRDCLPTSCPPARLPTLSVYLPTYLPIPTPTDYLTLPTLLDISQILNLVSRPTLSPSQHSAPLHLPSRSITSQSCTLARRPLTHDKSHRCRRYPRRCAPVPAAASSKSGRPWDRSRPAGRLHTPVPCSLCTSTSTHAGPAPRPPLPFAFWTRSRPSRHNNTSIPLPTLQFHPDLSSPEGPEG